MDKNGLTPHLTLYVLYTSCLYLVLTTSYGSSIPVQNHPQLLRAVIALLALPTSHVILAETPQEIVVTATRTPVSVLEVSGNISAINDEAIRATNAIHPYELGVRIPGVWVSRGSGQEHLTAVRSPVLTGPGSCGAFLVMENNVPTRPAGLCNANQLFEVATEQSFQVETIRGPAGSLYGSNGLHGTFNFLLPEPGQRPGVTTSLEGGSNDYYRARAQIDQVNGENGWNAGLVAERDGGFREDSGYKQTKGFWSTRHKFNAGLLKTTLSGSWLDQDTAGYITGKDAYKDPEKNRTNPNPEAYRKASSLRAQATWLPDQNGSWNTQHTGFLRWSEMDFLMHFLPGKPQEKNGQVSGGYMFLSQRDFGSTNLKLGFDSDFASGTLEQIQDNPSTSNRPEGQQYDYSVRSAMLAPYAQINVAFSERISGLVGVRLEYMRYDYKNRMISGNTDENGQDCAAASGCLYYRPEDRSDDFFNAAPELGLLWRVGDELSLFSNLRRGFRAPQATELYRLQAQQDINNIKSETIDSFEIGLRAQHSRINYELLAFAMKKDNYIFKNADDLYVNDGKSKHIGIEAGLFWRIAQPVYFSFAGTYAKHTYDFDLPGGSFPIQSGDRVDTAPDLIGSAQIGYEHRFGKAELEWVHNDKYFLEPSNTYEYEGHNLINLRLIGDITPNWWAALRVKNLTDTDYADRADYSGFSGYRYFPGRGREYFLEIGYRNNLSN